MWASCLATVLPREARGTASKPFWGMALASLRLIALLTRHASRTCSSKEWSFKGDSWLCVAAKRDRRRNSAHRGERAEITERKKPNVEAQGARRETRYSRRTLSIAN